MNELRNKYVHAIIVLGVRSSVFVKFQDRI